MWSKKDAHITERRKKFQPEKVQNWRCGIHIEKKKSLNYTSETQKSLFQFLILKCFYMLSLPTANFSLIRPNFCTPYCPKYLKLSKLAQTVKVLCTVEVITFCQSYHILSELPHTVDVTAHCRCYHTLSMLPHTVKLQHTFEVTTHCRKKPTFLWKISLFQSREKYIKVSIDIVRIKYNVR